LIQGADKVFRKQTLESWTPGILGPSILEPHPRVEPAKDYP